MVLLSQKYFEFKKIKGKFDLSVTLHKKHRASVRVARNFTKVFSSKNYFQTITYHANVRCTGLPQIRETSQRKAFSSTNW